MRAIVATRETSGRPDFPGNTWVPLQYMLGLERLGVDAYWVDRQSAIDPGSDFHSLEYLVARFEATAHDFGFADRWCIAYDDGERCFGISAADLDGLIDEADLLLNVAGHLPEGSPLMRIPRRAYLDLDPGFTQIWGRQVDMSFERHTHFFTVGQNVGRPDFPIPTDGVDWQPFLPPVVLDAWPARIDGSCERLSTIADWRGSQNALFDARQYSGKREEFIRFLDVPQRAGRRIELALCIGQHDYEDLGLLLGHDWRVREPSLYAGDLESYREFIQLSRAEFSVAKSGYLRSRGGWFSDRTACYLASGKPAIVQSTDVEWRLPTGTGLITFRTVDEAVAAIEAVEADYEAHCHAARRLAEEHFDSDAILETILDRMGA